jgi:general nucleoside transport system permease protein
MADPFTLHLEPRLRASVARQAAVSCAGVVLALGVGALLLRAAGVPPFAAYGEMAVELFGSAYGFSEVLVKATPLILCGLGVMVAFKMLFWNIGAEGQLHMGAWAATAVAMLPWPGDRPWLRLPLMALAGIAAGGLWALVPAALKIGRQVNEVVTSLLLNYVAIAWVDHFVYGPWRDPASSNFPLTPMFPESAQLLRFGTYRTNIGLILALAAVALVYVVQERSRLGFAIRVMGDNPAAARYAGINLAGTTLAAMALSGGLAGLAGMVELAGIQHRLLRGFSPGYGYTAIIVAWLGRLHPAGVLVSGLLLGALLAGGEVLQISRQLPVSMIFMIEGALLLTLLAGDFFNRYRIVWRRASSPAAPAPAPMSEH